MIRKLRKKFIAAALAAVFLVLLVLIGAINALSYRSLVSDADGTLQILADNNGSFPRQMFRAQDRPSDMKTPPNGGGGGPSGERRGSGSTRGISRRRNGDRKAERRDQACRGSEDQTP